MYFRRAAGVGKVTYLKTVEEGFQDEGSVQLQPAPGADGSTGQCTSAEPQPPSAPTTKVYLSEQTGNQDLGGRAKKEKKTFFFPNTMHKIMTELFIFLHSDVISY